MMMMRRSMTGTLIALVLAASGSAGAQENQRQAWQDKQKQEKEEKEALDMQALAAIEVATLAPQCFTSGSGATFLKVCITERGNISFFESPAGKVHLNTREGYVLCSNRLATLGVHGFDAGSAQAGWAAPTVSQPGGPGTLPLIITRNSFDGVVELKQTFKVVPAEREVNVTMAVKNRSTQATLPNAVLDRYFDGDINGETLNAYDLTGSSVWGLPGSATHSTGNNGLMLTQAPSAVVIFPSFGMQQTFVDWNPNGTAGQSARQCRGPSQSSQRDDFVGRVSLTLGDIAPGQTKSVTFRYHRF
jgi:hypothetical protein